MAYIIDSYNKYDSWDRAHSLHIFYFNDIPFAIKKVSMEWGLPTIPTYADTNNYEWLYKIYDTYDDALKFVHSLRS